MNQSTQLLDLALGAADVHLKILAFTYGELQKHTVELRAKLNAASITSEEQTCASVATTYLEGVCRKMTTLPMESAREIEHLMALQKPHQDTTENVNTEKEKMDQETQTDDMKMNTKSMLTDGNEPAEIFEEEHHTDDTNLDMATEVQTTNTIDKPLFIETETNAQGKMDTEEYNKQHGREQENANDVENADGKIREEVEEESMEVSPMPQMTTANVITEKNDNQRRNSSADEDIEEEEEDEEEVTPKNTEELFKMMNEMEAGSKRHVKFLEKYDRLMANQGTEVKIWENGINFEEKIGAFTHVHLFRTKEGLGLVTPTSEIQDPETNQLKYVDIDFENVNQFFKQNKMINMIDSRKGTSRNSKLEKFLEPVLEERKRGGIEMERKEVLNILSLEVSREEKFKNFVIPLYARQNGMVEIVREKIAEKMDEIEKKRSNIPQKQNKDEVMKKKKLELKAERRFLKKVGDQLPNVEKFLLLSMRESFTGIHVDFSGTSVFYHVIKGEKIFYIAPPSERNMEIYMESEMEKDGNKKKEILQALHGEFRKLTIAAGHTAFIPAGYIHFVYTPKDSIVVGGNFLRRESADFQFRLTKMELAAKTPIEQTFRNFFISMFAYLKLILIPALHETTEDPINRAAGETFLKELEDEKDSKEKVFKVEEKRELLQALKSVLEGKGSKKRNNSEEPEDAPEPKKMAIEDENVPCCSNEIIDIENAAQNDQSNVETKDSEEKPNDDI